MGNIVRGVSLLSNVRYFPYHVQLGGYAAINVTKVEEEQKEENGGGHEVKWKVSYTIDGSKCELDFAINSGKDRKVKWIYFALHDDICGEGGFHLRIGKDEVNLLKLVRFAFCGNFDSTPDNMTTVHAGDSVTHTSVYVYGSGSKGGLVVWEWKKKSEGEKPYMRTVAHYYASSSGNFFDRTRMDIGLSMIVKVQVSNDKGLDVTVEGPAQHPAAALFHMFDEVKRSGTWKPTSCPHFRGSNVVACSGNLRVKTATVVFHHHDSMDLGQMEEQVLLPMMVQLGAK